MGTFHEEGCEAMEGLYVQVMEVEAEPMGHGLRSMIEAARQA